MKKNLKCPISRLSLIAATLAMTFAAQAQEIDPERLEAIGELALPRSEISIGFGLLSDGSRRLGQYSGLRDKGGKALIDLGVFGLDKASGTWTRFYGRNLGLESREAFFEQNRQGHWRYFLGFSQTPRFEPYVVNTAVSGIGSGTVTVPATSSSGNPVDLSLRREMISAGFDQAIDKTKAVRVRFTHETKEGARIYGRGTVGAIEFLPEPNDRTTETFELSLSHAGKDFQLSGGYYGTLFVNHVNGLDVLRPNASTNALDVAPKFSPMSQPLSNDSHQFFLTGGYNLTPLTRSSFKVSETVARQNENFISVSPAATFPGAPTSLDGRVDTLLAYVDLTSVEFDRLDLQGNVRYEDRDDKTPVNQFMTGAPVAAALPSVGLAGVTGFNKPRSWSSLKYKAEAGYQLPAEFKLVAGWELDQQKRNAPESFRKVNFREETDETTTRLELKRLLLDTLSGSISYALADRSGSDYLLDTYVQPAASPSVNPLLWADRKRSAWKGTVDWSPTDKWALHLVHEQADDSYSGFALGPRDGSRTFTSIDASYALSDRWHAHFWWSSDDIKAKQSTMVNPNNPPLALRGQLWQADLRQMSDGLGAGVQGKLRSGLELGLDVTHSKQTAEQRMTALTGNPIASLPDYSYHLTEVRVFGSYPLDKASGVRVNYAYYDWRTDDWTWTDWRYTDGTTLTQEARQKTHFVGASYYYRWQ